MNKNASELSANFIRNRKGHYVPIEDVSELDQLRDKTIRSIFDMAAIASEMLHNFKTNGMADIQAFCDLSAEQYGVTVGGGKGNVTLTTFDGLFQIKVCISDHIDFGEEINAAKELIDACMERWSAGANSNLLAAHKTAFKPGKDGRLKTRAILALRSLKPEPAEPEWDKAMEALDNAIDVTGSTTYLRLYSRPKPTDKFTQLPLDIASI